MDPQHRYNGSKCNKNPHHYAFDAASLLRTCRQRLQDGHVMVHSGNALHILLHLDQVLNSIESLLHAHCLQLIECERHSAAVVAAVQDNETATTTTTSTDSFADDDDQTENNDSDGTDDMESIPYSLEESLRVLAKLLEALPVTRALSQTNLQTKSSSSWSDLLANTAIPTDEARMSAPSSTSSQSSISPQVSSSPSSSQPEPLIQQTRRSVTDSLLFRLIVMLQLCLVRINDVRNLMGWKDYNARTDANNNKNSANNDAIDISPTSIISSSTALCVGFTGTMAFVFRPYLRIGRESKLEILTKLSLSILSVTSIYTWWMRLWMVGKLSNSSISLEEWKEQWVQSGAAITASLSNETSNITTQTLIDFVRNQSPKMSFWQSEGELRFLVLKRAMDLLYASVGTALEVNKPNRPSTEGPSWQISLTAMAAASYFSVIGPNKRAAQAVNEASSDLIQNAWGMVSLPAIKLLSLRATRLLKGASLAERIVIDGVPCFILSRGPCPDVISALKRFARQERRRLLSKRLSTIDEMGKGLGRHSSHSSTLRKRNVIFHLTGGGFFAHTLASDLPYLLDWSKTTGAIVICPEYSLLPEHTFPVALVEVTRVYTSLFNGDASLQLGFDVQRLVVTGESAGGNLAAAMCIKIAMAHLPRDRKFCPNSRDVVSDHGYHPDERDPIQLPHALMLSCPALNLSLELSPSRVIGDKDPVLPSGLISAISDAYAPVSKYDPLVSPLFASDECLRRFPPTLLYCSSDDPLLDDSVDFNTRLKQNGVESELRATHHMPHAYWGLGTAGFPEARQVQVECAEFLKKKLECDG